MSNLVYFSSASDNTHRFIGKLGLPADRIPLTRGQGFLSASEPYVLVVPTYGGGSLGGAVPKQVVKFLNNEHNRSLLRGVIAAGNTNFGTSYGRAGEVISAKCQVPLLYKFELMGTTEDVMRVRDGLARWWEQQQIPA